MDKENYYFLCNIKQFRFFPPFFGSNGYYF